MFTPSDNDYQRAVHEVGHVLVGFGLGWPVETVSISGGDSGCGEAGCIQPNFWRAINENIDLKTKYAFELSLAYIAAGAAAEILVFGEAIGDVGDRQNLRKDLGRYAELVGSLENLCVSNWDQAVGLAKGILSYHYHYSKTLEIIAKKLVDEKTLDGNQFSQLVIEIHEEHREKEKHRRFLESQDARVPSS